MSPHKIRKCCSLMISIGLLNAADPSWKNKPIPQWDEEDAKQVLTNSPWVKSVIAVQLPELTAQQRREGGATGGGRGAGAGEIEGGLFAPSQGPRRGPKPSPGKLVLRWESAIPVRAAELKAREMGAPDIEGDDYAIAVYEVPNLNAGQKSLASELKRTASLKREGKKDLKPSGVEVLQEASGLAIVVYFFPRSEVITKEDGRLEFVAQIGRLSLAQYFFPDEMEFQGKLAL